MKKLAGVLFFHVPTVQFPLGRGQGAQRDLRIPRAGFDSQAVQWYGVQNARHGAGRCIQRDLRIEEVYHNG